MPPRFSQVLQRRRQELRLTTSQASRNLRLKEEVLIAFEEGDWSRIPRSGYAQGMLSSYARYLGLNPSEIILLFQEDFDDYSQGGALFDQLEGKSTPLVQSRVTQSTGPRSGSAATTGPIGAGSVAGAAGNASGGRRRRLRGQDLYGAQGPAGSMLAGSIEDAKIYGAREVSRPTPLSGSAEYGYSKKYLAQNTRRATEDTRYTHRNLYTKSTSETVRRGHQNFFGEIQGEYSNAPSRRQADLRYQTGEITTRQIQSHMFSDDLRYDSARPYEQASSSRGRLASKNIVTPQRPNVQRRASSPRPGQGERGGEVAQKETFFSNTKRTMVIAFLILAAILLVLITLGIRSCASKMETNNQPAQIANPDQSATTQDATEQTNNDYVEVKVEVLQGDVTWLEIKDANNTDVAQTITGPWSKTYQVTSTLQVKAAEASAVSITANGQAVSFDKSSAGLSVATINAADFGVAPADQNADAKADNASNSNSYTNASDKTKNSSSQTSNSSGSSGSSDSNSSGSSKSGSGSSKNAGSSSKN